MDKDKNLCGNINSVSIYDYSLNNMSDKTTGLKTIFSLSYDYVIIIVFYKTNRNAELAFDLAITCKFFDLFCTKILVFLFAMIYYSISEYLIGNKIISFFDRKIIQKEYCNV